MTVSNILLPNLLDVQYEYDLMTKAILINTDNFKLVFEMSLILKIIEFKIIIHEEIIDTPVIYLFFLDMFYVVVSINMQTCPPVVIINDPKRTKVLHSSRARENKTFKHI